MNEESYLLPFSERINTNLVFAGMPNCQVNFLDKELIIEGQEHGFTPLKWVVETRNHIDLAQALQLISLKNLLVVAEKIDNHAKKLFKAHRISYMEPNGAFYLIAKGLLIHVPKESKNAKPESTKKHSYNKNWLKFYLLLLSRTEAANWTQRKISSSAKISTLALNELFRKESKTIKKIADLPLSKDLGFISDLLDKWLEIYTVTDIGQKKLGTFQMPLNLGSNILKGGVWSGKIAAKTLNEQHITDKSHKRAEIRLDNGIIYIGKPIQELIKELDLIPNPEGKLKVYSQPWTETINQNGLAPLPIIIADLLQGDSRSVKEARNLQTIYLAELMSRLWVEN